MNLVIYSQESLNHEVEYSQHTKLETQEQTTLLCTYAQHLTFGWVLRIDNIEKQNSVFVSDLRKVEEYVEEENFRGNYYNDSSCCSNYKRWIIYPHLKIPSLHEPYQQRSQTPKKIIFQKIVKRIWLFNCASSVLKNSTYWTHPKKFLRRKYMWRC